MTALDPAQLDAEIAANVKSGMAERAKRRKKMRRVRQQFDELRQHGKAKAHATKLAREKGQQR